MTIWEEHCRRWSVCQACPLGGRATHHVLGRGSLPCDVLFIGEGPNKTEDTVGAPLVGQTARLLDQAVADTGVGKGLRIFITNIVACRPCDTEDGPNRMPKWADEVGPCRRRVLEVVDMAQPRLIVSLGGVAGAWVVEAQNTCQSTEFGTTRYAFAQLPHPAWILRQGGTASDEYPKFIKALKRALESL